MGYYSIGFSYFPDISCFPGVLGLFVCVCVCVCVCGGGWGGGPPSVEDAWVVQSFSC